MNHKILDLLYESNLIEEEPDGLMMKQAVKAWAHLERKKTLRLNDILVAHRLLMAESDLAPQYVGALRTIDVWIGGTVAPSYFHVPALLDNWLLDFMAMEPVLAHIRFEHIHPFADGNGRIGRLLWIWHCVRTMKKLPAFSNATKFEDYYPLFTSKKEL